MNENTEIYPFWQYFKTMVIINQTNPLPLCREMLLFVFQPTSGYLQNSTLSNRYSIALKNIHISDLLLIWSRKNETWNIIELGYYSTIIVISVVNNPMEGITIRWLLINE